jgi:hypothetical protein
LAANTMSKNNEHKTVDQLWRDVVAAGITLGVITVAAMLLMQWWRP